MNTHSKTFKTKNRVFLAIQPIHDSMWIHSKSQSIKTN